jgi:hypothetical protein
LNNLGGDPLSVLQAASPRFAKEDSQMRTTLKSLAIATLSVAALSAVPAIASAASAEFRADRNHASLHNGPVHRSAVRDGGMRQGQGWRSARWAAAPGVAAGAVVGAPDAYDRANYCDPYYGCGYPDEGPAPVVTYYPDQPGIAYYPARSADPDAPVDTTAPPYAVAPDYDEDED